MTFTQSERDYLDGQPLGPVATVRPDGTPQNNPVGFQYDPATGTIDIGGMAMAKTHKFANVAATGAGLPQSLNASPVTWDVVPGLAQPLRGVVATAA
jgi:hypothetical protein